MLLLSEDGGCSRSRRILRVRKGARQTTLHGGSLAIGWGIAALPEHIRAEVSGAVKVHRHDIEDSSDQEEEASDQWEGIQEMAHYLGGEQKLKNSQSD